MPHNHICTSHGDLRGQAAAGGTGPGRSHGLLLGGPAGQPGSRTAACARVVGESLPSYEPSSEQGRLAACTPAQPRPSQVALEPGSPSWATGSSRQGPHKQRRCSLSIKYSHKTICEVAFWTCSAPLLTQGGHLDLLPSPTHSRQQQPWPDPDPRPLTSHMRALGVETESRL